MSYTEEKIIEMLGTDIADHSSWVKDLELKDDFVGADTFYLSESVTRAGKTSDTNKDYAEVVAGFLLENNFIEKDKFTGVMQISKKESYATNKDYSKDNSALNKIFKKYPHLSEQFGAIIEQSISLSNYEDDKAGIIDYLTYKKESNELFIIQVKPQSSKETLLSAVLELQTYYQTIDKEKLVSDLYSVGKIDSKNLKIRKALILISETTAYNEYYQEQSNMAKVIKDLQIEEVFINDSLEKIMSETRLLSEILQDGKKDIPAFLLGFGLVQKDKIGISQITRKNSYATNCAIGETFKEPISEHFGTIIEQSIPLFDYDDDKAELADIFSYEIDTLSYKKETDELFIVQVKPQSSKEPLLQSVLELQTYYQTVDKEKLVNDLYSAGKIPSRHPKIKKGLLLMGGSTAFDEYLYDDTMTHLKEIIKILQIKTISIRCGCE